MTVKTPPIRPRSPWSGSRHETEYRWQLDGVRSLPAAASELRAIAAELQAAHAAGWSLVEPMLDGHLLATRPSRRQRAECSPVSAGAGKIGTAPQSPRWRVRLVTEPPVDDQVLQLSAARRTPVLRWVDGALQHDSRPTVAADMLAALTRQVSMAEVEEKRWGVAPARVGPNVDLVAEGSALRIHAVDDGALVRLVEVLTFQHAADQAPTLPDAAAAYERLAQAADAMAAAGGRLVGVDDGMLDVRYGRDRTALA